jgi:hypothetical protein
MLGVVADDTTGAKEKTVNHLRYLFSKNEEKR